VPLQLGSSTLGSAPRTALPTAIQPTGEPPLKPTSLSRQRRPASRDNLGGSTGHGLQDQKVLRHSSTCCGRRVSSPTETRRNAVDVSALFFNPVLPLRLIVSMSAQARQTPTALDRPVCNGISRKRWGSDCGVGRLLQQRIRRAGTVAELYVRCNNPRPVLRFVRQLSAGTSARN
jgi:hypothetical protein